MLKKHFRSLCLILSLLLLLSIVLPACTGKDDSTSNNSVNTTDPSATDLYTPPEKVDLDGHEMTILTREEPHFLIESTGSDSGEQVEVAVYERNSLVESELNCSINVIIVPAISGRFTNTFSNIVDAGTGEIQLALHHMMYAARDLLTGIGYDWSSIKEVDYSQPWWHQSFINEMSYNGKMTLTASDMCLSSATHAWLMVFNLKMAEENKIDVYDLVDSGQWTLENFKTLVRDSYVDNGNGTIDVADDTFGFVTHFESAITNWLFALDVPIGRITNAGDVKIFEAPERMINVTESIYQMIYDDYGTLYFTTDKLKAYGISNHDAGVLAKFSANQALFAATRIYALDHLRNKDVSYGIIPYPKYNEDQTNYYSHVDGGASAMYMPFNISEEDAINTAIITNWLSYISMRDVMPVIQKVAFLGRYSEDAVAYKMLQKTLEGRTYTFAFIYSFSTGARPYWTLTNLMYKKSNNFVSEWENYAIVAERDFKEIMDAIK